MSTKKILETDPKKRQEATDKLLFVQSQLALAIYWRGNPTVVANGGVTDGDVKF